MLKLKMPFIRLFLICLKMYNGPAIWEGSRCAGQVVLSDTVSEHSVCITFPDHVTNGPY